MFLSRKKRYGRKMRNIAELSSLLDFSDHHIFPDQKNEIRNHHKNRGGLGRPNCHHF